MDQSRVLQDAADSLSARRPVIITKWGPGQGGTITAVRLLATVPLAVRRAVAVITPLGGPDPILADTLTARWPLTVLAPPLEALRAFLRTPAGDPPLPAWLAPYRDPDTLAVWDGAHRGHVRPFCAALAGQPVLVVVDRLQPAEAPADACVIALPDRRYASA